MSLPYSTYSPLPWIEAPVIETGTLWILGALFGTLGLLYFFLIFYLRNRISRRKKHLLLQKRELAPMINNFLFFNQEEDVELREEYIRMKLEIREQLKTPFNRKVMTEVLMDLRQDLSGQALERLLNLYQDLGLEADAFKKLQSWRWERVSQGILELTEMRVDKAYTLIRKFINDRRGVIRKQAQLALVILKKEGINYFLDTARYRISEWQQLKLLEVLRGKQDYDPPRFKAWLTSENKDVVLFALRLIRHYRQNDAEAAIVTLLRHKRQPVQLAAIDCIKEFGFASARWPLKQLFKGSGEELKVAILDAIWHIGVEDDMEFLAKAAHDDGSFIVRSKAKAVMNEIEPDSAMPSADLQPAFPGSPEVESVPPPAESSKTNQEGSSGFSTEGTLRESKLPEETGEIVHDRKEIKTEEPGQEPVEHPEENSGGSDQASPEPDVHREEEKAAPAQVSGDRAAEPELQSPPVGQEDKGAETTFVEPHPEPVPGPAESVVEEGADHPQGLNLKCDFALPKIDITDTKPPTDEELALFDLCLWQELASILDLAKPIPDGVNTAEFLPVVIDEEAVAVSGISWISELEVEAEHLEQKASESDVHPTESALNEAPEHRPKSTPTDKNPETHALPDTGMEGSQDPESTGRSDDATCLTRWVMDLPVVAEGLAEGISETPAEGECPDTSPANTIESKNSAMDSSKKSKTGAPLTSVQATEWEEELSCASEEIALTPLFRLSGTPVACTERGMGNAALVREERVENAQVFSIFREFFGEYDKESKLIMMGQISEVGGEKEWEFLKSLQRDPEAEVRERAAFLADLLARRLWGEGGAPARRESPKALEPIEDLNFVPDLGAAQIEAIPEPISQKSPQSQWPRWPFRFKKLKHE